jgi:hypothetical protein
MIIDLTDEELINLKWLLEALGADGGLGVRVMMFAATGPWASSLWAKLVAPASKVGVPPIQTLDDLRIALGEYAATAQTQQEVNDLRSAQSEVVGTLDQITAALDLAKVAAAPIVDRVKALAAAVPPDLIPVKP